MNYLKYLGRGWNRKEGRGHKDFKKGVKLGQGVRALKRRGGWNSLRNYVCPSMEYCGHIWDGALSCYLELLNKLQKQICRTVGSSLAASFKPLAHQ